MTGKLSTWGNTVNRGEAEVDSISECWQFSCHPVSHVIFILLYRKTLFSERTEQYRVFDKCSSVLYTAFNTAPIDVIIGVNWCGGETTWILIFKEFMYLFDIFHHSRNYFQTHYSFPWPLSIILSIFFANRTSSKVLKCPTFLTGEVIVHGCKTVRIPYYPPLWSVRTNCYYIQAGLRDRDI